MLIKNIHNTIGDISNSILRSYNTRIEVNSPPCELTLKLFYLELIDQSTFTEAKIFIQNLINSSNKIWIDKELSELALIFDIDIDEDLLTTLSKEYMFTTSWHKFSCIFGANTKIQTHAINEIERLYHIKQIFNLPRFLIYRFLTLTYLSRRNLFNSLVNELRSENTNSNCYIVSMQNYGFHKQAESCELIDYQQPESECLKRDQHSRKLNIAICISGQLRGYYCHQQTIENLNLSNHHCQLFVSTWRRVGGRIPDLDQLNRIFPVEIQDFMRHILVSTGPAEFKRRYPSLCRHIDRNDFVTEAELIDFFKTDNIIVEDDDVEPFNNFPSIVKMHYKMQNCFNQVIKSNKDFDLVIRLRPDLLIDKPTGTDWSLIHAESKAKRLIYADFGTYISPRVINWTIGDVLPLMIGDLFATGTLLNMSTYMNSFSLNIDLQNSNILGLPRGFMPHTTLSRILMYHGISVEAFPFSAISGVNLQEAGLLTLKQISTALDADLDDRTPDSIDKFFRSILNQAYMV